MNLVELPVIHCPETAEEFKEILSKSGCCQLQITPIAAQMILDNFNNSNRDFKPSNRLVVKTALLNNEFKTNGATICFSHDNLIDGQHRLGGIVDANIKTTLLTMFGLDNDVLSTIDKGMKRAFRDDVVMMSKIDNKPENKMSAQEEQLLKWFINGTNPHYIKKLSFNEKYKLWDTDKYRNAIKFAQDNLNPKNSTTGIGSIAQRAVIARAYFCGENQSKLKTFCEKLRAGAATKESGCPILNLFNKLTNSRKKVNKSSNSPMYEVLKYKFTELYLNCYLKNEDAKNFHISSWTNELFDINTIINKDKSVDINIQQEEPLLSLV